MHQTHSRRQLIYFWTPWAQSEDSWSQSSRCPAIHRGVIDNDDGDCTSDGFLVRYLTGCQLAPTSHKPFPPMHLHISSVHNPSTIHANVCATICTDLAVEARIAAVLRASQDDRTICPPQHQHDSYPSRCIGSACYIIGVGSRPGTVIVSKHWFE